MATTTVDDRRARVGRQSDAVVIFASSLGTVFEWYDFYLYATLATFFAAAPHAEIVERWKDPEAVPQTIARVREFLSKHTPK